MFIAKGAPYITEEGLKIWISGKVVNLTQNQKILWEFCFGQIRKYGDLILFMEELALRGMPMKKDLMQHTIMQLKSLGVISYSKKDSQEDSFKMIFSNRIIPIKKDGLQDNFDIWLYERIEQCDNMSVADIIADMDNIRYEELTNGYDEKYLSYIFNAPHAYSVKKSILNMIKNGNVCIV